MGDEHCMHILHCLLRSLFFISFCIVFRVLVQPRVPKHHFRRPMVLRQPLQKVLDEIDEVLLLLPFQISLTPLQSDVWHFDVFVSELAYNPSSQIRN
jgi:hypothetical protein